jgi:hypothetical protein
MVLANTQVLQRDTTTNVLANSFPKSDYAPAAATHPCWGGHSEGRMVQVRHRAYAQ